MLGFGRAFFVCRLIVQVDFQLSLQRVNRQFRVVQVRLVHVDGVDVGIFIGGVVVDPFFLVHARRIDGVFVLTWGHFAQALDLFNGVEDLQKLVDGADFVRFANAVELGKDAADKARLAGQVAWQPEPAHTAGIFGEFYAWTKSVLLVVGRKGEVVVQGELHDWEWRVVGHDADWVVVNVEAVFHGFDHDGAGLVSDHPVQG